MELCMKKTDSQYTFQKAIQYRAVYYWFLFTTTETCYRNWWINT